MTKKRVLCNSTGKLGKHINSSGYVVRTLASFTKTELKLLRPMMRSPNKKKRQNSTEILEHRAVMALHLGRPLTPHEVVHHINGIKDDNRVNNLELHTIGEHSKYHNDILAENKQLKLEIEQLKEQYNVYN